MYKHQGMCTKCWNVCNKKTRKEDKNKALEVF